MLLEIIYVRKAIIYVCFQAFHPPGGPASGNAKAGQPEVKPVTPAKKDVPGATPAKQS
jgi:hypothetical protein